MRDYTLPHKANLETYIACLTWRTALFIITVQSGDGANPFELFRKGDDNMSSFELLQLVISFAALVVLILTYSHKK